MSTKDLLNEYNELAASVGRKPLKVWKESKAKLQHRIDALKHTIEDTDDATNDDATNDEDSDFVTIAELARELGRNPKVVRAKLRRVYDDADADVPKPIGDRWKFARDEREALIELITS